MKISVCIATYNGEKYIEEQLLSILPQIGENDEVIISDDYSTDNTLDIIRNLNDSRIKIFLNAKEKGYTKNFENALEKASGDIIFLSDQDDIWNEDKVRVSLKYLEKNDMVVSNAEIVNSYLEKNNQTIFEFRRIKTGFINNFIQIKYLGCTMAFKKKVLYKALPFPSNQRLVPHDSWLALIGELFFKVSLIKKPLMLYRRHDSNVSNGGAKSTNSFLKKIEIRIYAMFHLIKRVFNL